MLLSVETVLGAFLAGIVGIITVIAAKHYGELRTKKYTVRAFLEVVEENQKHLEPLYQLYGAYKAYHKGSEESLSNNSNEVTQTITSPKSISFDRTIYSALADKIGLINRESREKLVHYYVKLKSLEKHYNSLESIHGIDIVYLDILELKIAAGWAEEEQTRDKIVDCLTNVEEIYIVGDELKEGLKELKIMLGIKSMLSLKITPLPPR